MEISVRTLEHYRTKMMRKLKLNSGAALLCFAMKAQLYGLFHRAPTLPRGNGGNGSVRHAEGSPSMTRPHNGQRLTAGSWQGGLP